MINSLVIRLPEFYPIRSIILGFLLMFLLTQPLGAQTDLIDSLKATWSTRDADTSRLRAVYDLTSTVSEKNFEEALELGQFGQTLSKQLGLGDWNARFDHQISQIYQLMAKYDLAIEQINQAIAHYQKTGNAEDLADVTSFKAYLMINTGKFSEALQLYFDVLDIQETAGNESGQAGAYTRIAETLFYLERYEEGVEYGEKAIRLYDKTADQEGLSNAYQKTAMCLLGEDEHEKALSYIEEALAIKRTLDVHPIAIGSLLNSRGNTLKHLKRYEEALAAYHESKAIVEKLNHRAGIGATNGNISDVYMRMGKYQEALPYQQKAVELIEESGFNENYIENVGNLAMIYKEVGDYKNALQYYQKYQAARDSAFNKEKAAITEELTTKYQTEEKEKLLARRQSELYLSLGGLAVILSIAFGLWWAYRNKNKHNRILEKRNEEKEFLLKEIHHRVKNNLQVLSSLLRLQSYYVKDPAAMDVVAEGMNRVQSMGLIHQKLYMGDNVAAVEMEDYIQDLSKHLLDSFGLTDQVEVTIKNEAPPLDVDSAIPLGLIINELITNSLKYAFPDKQAGRIRVHLWINPQDHLCLQVADNGVGKGSPAVASANSTSFGTDLVKILSKKLKGRIRTESVNGYSTQIECERYRMRVE